MTAIDIYPLSAAIVCDLTGYTSSTTGAKLLREYKIKSQIKKPKVYDYAMHLQLSLPSVVQTIRRTRGIVLFIPDHLKIDSPKS